MRRRSRGGVALEWILSSARVVRTAGICAGVLSLATRRDAVGAPLSADVVWEGLGELGQIGADTVVAYAGCLKSIL